MGFVGLPYEKPEAARPTIYMLSGHLDFAALVSEWNKLETKTASHKPSQAFRQDKVRSVQLLSCEKENRRNVTFVLQFEDSVCTTSLNDHKLWKILTHGQ